MRKERWGKKYEDKRDWREYNEKLVARGEAYISLWISLKRGIKI